MGAPARSGTTSVMPSPSGITAQSRFDGTKISISPEYSNQTGVSIGLALASMLGEQAAVGVLLTAGADKTELLLNAGFKLDERQRFIVSVGQLKQFLDFAFASGTEKLGITQNSGGISYQLQLGGEFLRFLETNGYVSKTASRDLADKTFAVDTATLYELWNDPRRIAGGQVSGLQGKLGFTPLKDSTIKVSFGYERLSYDLLTGKDSTNRPTGGLEWLQKLGSGYQAKLGAETFAAQQRYTAGIERNIADGSAGRHKIGFNLIGLQGRDGLRNDNQFQLTYSYIFGAGNSSSRNPAFASNANSVNRIAAGNTVPTPEASRLTSGGDLLDQVAMRPSYLPGQVLAKIDKTALPIRLVAIDKTGLPVGASIAANGVITVPLGVVVTGIAGVTLNGGVFANGGQFAVSGSNMTVNPNVITQPAAGVTDTYVVTANNVGGGTTLVTITVVRGSVRITSIVVTAGTGNDTTPPTTTAAPSISVAATTSAVSVSQTINENGTGYYLILPAASAAPTVAAVKAGTSFAMTANTPAVAAITGLTANTAYKYYFVAKDAANNDQAAVSTGLAITTTSGLPAGYISQGGLTWSPELGWDNRLSWSGASNYCSGFSGLGQSGWRLPTKDELVALANSGQVNGNGWVQGWEDGDIWSSTIYTNASGSNHYVVQININPLYSGGAYGESDSGGNRVSCVR